MKIALAFLLTICGAALGGAALINENRTGPDQKDTLQKTPALFAPGIISTGHEFGITFTPDGQEIYFTRYSADKRMHIYRSRLSAREWQSPLLIDFSQDDYSDLDPSLSPDGKRLFFVSTRPKPQQEPDSRKKDMDIWLSDLVEDHWSSPRWLENINSVDKEGSPSVTRDGMLYFFSNRENKADANSIYSAEFVDGHYAKPERLPLEINSGPSDTSPFISPDGKTLLFYSTRPGGFGGGDLYVAVKKGGRWQQAVNLGSSVNTKEWEYNPSVSPDGERLYFGRGQQIYVMPTAALALKDLQPKQFR